jgi:hypothetical protein
VELAADFLKAGKLSLEDGTWTATTPYADHKLTLDGEAFPDIISGTTSSNAAIVRDTELDKWDRHDAATVDFGVNDVQRPLLTKSLLLLPADDLTITPTVSYSMVTQDNTLELGYITDKNNNRYSRITNRITGQPSKISFKGGKRYKLLLHIGVESVQFEVVSVEDWDLPIRLDPVDVTPNSEETITKIVSEE